MNNNIKRPSKDLLPYCRTDLRGRISYAFRHEDIKTLGDLCSKPDYELLRIPNFGRKSVAEIKIALVAFGLELAKNPMDREQEQCLIARWKPIETAPKDGTIILATNSEWVATMSFMPMPSWKTSDGYFRFRGVFGSSKGFDLINQPTHWVHLPKPLEPR